MIQHWLLVQHLILNFCVLVVHSVSLILFRSAAISQRMNNNRSYYCSIELITIIAQCVHTFDFGGLLELFGGSCCSSGSIVNSTALLAINLFVQTCFISCNTCSSTPSSRKESRTPAITSSITA